MRKACDHCGVEFNARPADVRRGRGRFCSHGCSSSFNDNLGLKGEKMGAPKKEVEYFQIGERYCVPSELLPPQLAARVKDIDLEKKTINLESVDPVKERRIAIFAKWGKCQDIDDFGNVIAEYDKEGNKL